MKEKRESLKNRFLNLTKKDDCFSSSFKLILFLLFLSAPSSVTMLRAQDKKMKVEGVVVDENKSTLPGVSVFIKGTSVGTVTDENGRFIIYLPDAKDSLNFSYIGYNNQAVKCTPAHQRMVRIQLMPAHQEIAELVVVAYGTTDRKAYTGAVSAVSAEQIQQNRSNNVLSSLQGMVPGLQLQNKAGAGGKSSQDIIIRGASSINGGIKPLYIIDGVPSEAMDQLSPDDIESISVLKDAAAISLYGARATNGVILISTKKGGTKGEKALVSYSGQVGVSTRTGKDYAKAGPRDYYELTWEALRNSALYGEKAGVLGEGKYPSAEAYASGELLNVLKYNAYNSATPVGLDGMLDPNAQLLWWEDYDKLLIKNGFRTEHNVNINGSSDRIKYFLSAGYLKQDGLEPGDSGFDRFTTRMNLSYDVFKNLTFGANMGMTASTSRSESVNNGYAQFATYARYTPGLYPLHKRNEAGELVKDSDGNLVLDFGDGPEGVLNSRRPDINTEGKGVNPLGTLDLDNSSGKSYYWFMNYFGEWQIIKGLNLKATYSNNISTSKSKYYTNRTLGGSKGTGTMSERQTLGVNWTFNSILSYEKAWRNTHRLRALIGAEINEKSGEDINTSSEGFLFDGMEETSNGATWKKPLTGNNSSKSRLVGFFSRVEYDLMNKYYVSASLRRDGASNFHPDSRWGNFWSVGGSWIFSNESFMKPLNWFTFGKLRASYGTSGNLGSNDFRSYYSTGYEFLGTPAVYISGLSNKDLRWEVNKQFNIGLETGFIQNRIRLNVDWYNRVTDDLFYSVPLAPSIGFDKVTKNIGSLKNTGFEISLTTDNIRNKDFTWTTNFNISRNRNKILKLNQDEFVSGSRIYKEGKSTTEFYISDWAGVNPENGLPMWWIDEVNTSTGERTGNRIKTYDYNETASKTVTMDDGKKVTYKNLGKYYKGSYTPTVSGGLNNMFRLKNFDLSFLFTYSLGAKILMDDYMNMMTVGNGRIKLYHQDMTNRWQKPGDITDVPRLSTESKYNYTAEDGSVKSITNNYNKVSSYHLRSGDYLKLKNVILGYTLPNQWVNKLKINSVRVYFQAENVFYISAEKGFDPEQVSAGSVMGQYPAMSTYSFGLKLNI